MITLPTPSGSCEQAYADTVTDSVVGSGGGRGSSAVITDARMGNSAEMSSRIRRYTITMAFRTACFISMIFVHGSFRWVLFAGAVLLPYVAVLFANQANKRTQPTMVKHTEKIGRPQITAGEPVEIVSGRVVDDQSPADDDPGQSRRVA